MAQIGSPSAGWYTDPSGQHRARYWDGANWTEQVRDDLGDGDAAVGAAPTPSMAHPAADTVAGVAEAVAAVAANDVAFSAAPGAELPLVVDVGADPTWGTASGNGQSVAHSFAGDPATESAPADPQPVPGPTAPIATGPAAGWYPDPAARHQARLWDGTTWTERVADNGIEGVDPLPGAPVTTATTVDPAVGGWSAELQGAADVAALDPDGPSLSAGQVSLGLLPETSEPRMPTEKAAPPRPSLKVRVGGGFVLGGALALFLGSAMTWIEITGPRVGDQSASTGLDVGDGRITLALAVVLAVLGAGIITGRMARFGGTKVAAMGSLVAGAAALAVAAVDIADVADRASRLGVPAGAVSNVGSGLWLVFVGALFAVGGGLMAFANRQ